MNQYQYEQRNIFGGSQKTISQKSIKQKLFELFENEPELKGADRDKIVWRYLQKYHRVDQAIYPEQFFDSSFPQLDSIRRVLDDVKKELHIN